MAERHGETTERHGEMAKRHGETTERHGEMAERHGETTERHGETTGLRERISVRRLLEGVEPIPPSPTEARKQARDLRWQRKEWERQRRELAALTNIKAPLDKQAEKYALRVHWLYTVTWIGIAALFFLLTIQLGREIISMVLFIIGLAALGPNIFFAATRQEWSTKAFYDFILERRKRKLYREARFDVKRYEDLRR